MAALIGARLAKYLQTTFPTADITLWSDSQIVLYWLSTKKTIKRFIENRVKDIYVLTSQYVWKYCPTSENPADLLTRGLTAEKFMKNDLWMKGPIWAVHHEVVTSLSADCFLQAVRRFSSRKSQPKLIVSDNAKTFQTASTYLKAMFESQVVRESLANTGIDWKFIPERAPCYGGWWERLIGLTKQTLKKILGRVMVDLETLQTFVTEIESLLNDRPLTFVSSSLEDPEPLTPAHLLYGRKIRPLPYVGAEIEPRIPSTVERNIISKRAKNQFRIIEQFWTRWRTEYLTALRERHNKPGNNSQTICTGEVLQVHQDSPRTRWKLAVVDSLIIGRDGSVRAARIRFSNGLYATRPIVKLYPLKVIDNRDCD
ncbi:uncharacterized protein LOC132720829 [Ruditapes philippinarum]|uniref:uncharacterized protein LOC132720829 n=1 Tax=Ruditapes philippinarum TaxID=129788 RepID=UPI00295B6952|nr:uncharacterized protein LOC132720829 [Ruditapes philippinarum]